MSRISYLPLTVILTGALITVSQARCPGCGSCKSLITFNAGLTPRIGFYLDRRAEIPAKLLDQDADVVCLQEYWFERDIKLLLSTVEETYPYHYSYLHSEVGTLENQDIPEKERASPCPCDDMEEFNRRTRACAIRNGCISPSGVATAASLPCVGRTCMLELGASGISPDCFQCVTTSSTNLTNLFEWCMPRAGEDNRINRPGLVILSKRPITKAAYRSYEPGVTMTLQRGFLKTKIKGMGLVLCTQMSEIIRGHLGEYLEYNLPYENYQEQQLHEIETLNAKFRNRNHILLGDLNMGPRVVRPDQERNLDGEEPCHFQYLLNTGYQTSYIQDDGRCTYCSVSNNFAFGHNNALGFVLFKGGRYSYRFAERVMDETTPYPLSDHYGIRATVCR